MSPVLALSASVGLLAGNAFFVAAEFALVASKQHRLEQSAQAGSRAAEAALAGSRELSMMLAGAQLGITLCTLGLGALAEPAIEHALEPLLHAAGLPAQASYAVAFLVSLVVVVFLHLVVGEMAPKSWAIAHPEKSALILALPFRAFARVTRPALVALNGLANAVLRLAKVDPQDTTAQAHGPDELRLLIEQSRQHGTIAVDQHRLLTRMLALQASTVGQVMGSRGELVTVARDSDAHTIERMCRSTGRSRLGVTDPAAADGRPASAAVDGGVPPSDVVVGIVHVRDAVKATASGSLARAGDLMTELYRVDAQQAVITAVTAMRAHRAQFALVVDDGRDVGFVALEDLLEEIIGEFYDETDRQRY
jgi:CBS domain containing-hemolysin-like protein